LTTRESDAADRYKKLSARRGCELPIRRCWWNKSGGMAFDLQAHHVARIERSGAEVHRDDRHLRRRGGILLSMVPVAD